MPFIRTNLPQDTSLAHQQGIVEGIHQALVDSIGMPQDELFQRGGTVRARAVLVQPHLQWRGSLRPRGGDRDHHAPRPLRRDEARAVCGHSSQPIRARRRGAARCLRVHARERLLGLVVRRGPVCDEPRAAAGISAIVPQPVPTVLPWPACCSRWWRAVCYTPHAPSIGCRPRVGGPHGGLRKR